MPSDLYGVIKQARIALTKRVRRVGQLVVAGNEHTRVRYKSPVTTVSERLCVQSHRNRIDFPAHPHNNGEIWEVRDLTSSCLILETNMCVLNGD